MRNLIYKYRRSYMVCAFIASTFSAFTSESRDLQESLNNHLYEGIFENLKQYPRIVSTNHTPFLAETNSEPQVLLAMSRPDRGDVEFRGGYDETRGGYVEGSLSFSWGDSESSSSSRDSEPNKERENEKDSSEKQ